MHTPGQWAFKQIVDDDGHDFWTVLTSSERIGDIWDEKNAAFIVRAVNAHDALVDALEAIIGHEKHLLNPHRVEAARAALALAKGEL